MHPFRFVFLFLPETSSSYNRLVIILCTLDARTRTILFYLPGEKWTKNWSNREPRSRILISLVTLPVIGVLFRISRHRNSIPPEFFPRHSERISPFERHRCEATYLRSSRKKGKKRHVRCSSFGFIDALAFSFDKAFVLPRFISTPRAALIPSPLAKHSNLPWNSLSLSLLPFRGEKDKMRDFDELVRRSLDSINGIRDESSLGYQQMFPIRRGLSQERLAGV